MRHRVATKWFVLFREDAGVICDCEVWILWLYGGGVWMYSSETLRGLAWQLIRYWKNDHFMVG